MEIRVFERCTARPLRPEESAGLAEELAAMDPWFTLGYSAAGLAHYLTREDPALERHGVVESGALAGVVCIRYPWLRGPFVELLAVLPAARRRGVGAEILSWVEADPRWQGGNVWITVSDFNLRARRFYERLGYAEVAELPRLVSTRSDELLLRKNLGEVS